MEADLTSNYFELFGLPVAFAIDSEALSLRYRDLQRVTHPDRFAGASDRERRLAVQYAARVNEAFQALKSPLARARYLLELNGAPLDDRDTAMDPAFLMEQMELREALGEVRDSSDPFAELERVRNDIEGRERALIAELDPLFAQATPDALAEARERVRKLQFMSRLLDEAGDIEEELVHASG